MPMLTFDQPAGDAAGYPQQPQQPAPAPQPQPQPQQQQYAPGQGPPPSLAERTLASQVHQLRQEVGQLTSMVMQLMQRNVVQLDTTTRRDTAGRIEGLTMIGKLE